MKVSSPLIPLEIQVQKPVLLSGAVLKFIPALSNFCGGDRHAIVYQQLTYLARDMQVGEKSIRAKRISLSRLQKQLHFVGRRHLIQVLRDLESIDYIKIERTRRVNVYIPECNIDSLFNYAAQFLSKTYFSVYIVIPVLAQTIGLKNAIVLQQIHIRSREMDGSSYFIRSIEAWHSQTFPFWGLATIKRIFSKLQELNLLFVRPYRREDGGFVNSYRVNYIGLAELLELPIPQAENPYKPAPDNPWDNYWQEWTNPVTLKKQIDHQ